MRKLVQVRIAQRRAGAGAARRNGFRGTGGPRAAGERELATEADVVLTTEGDVAITTES